jgi:hypothetical protein
LAHLPANASIVISPPRSRFDQDGFQAALRRAPAMSSASVKLFAQVSSLWHRGQPERTLVTERSLATKLTSLARQAIINTLLTCVSVFVGYVLMEFAIFRVMLPVAPLEIHSPLPATADVLTQTSKSDYLPHDFIAILGDSYAEGYGDWLIQAGGRQKGPFHSAHIIRQQTGRDVASFGIGGAGSAEAMVLRPAEIYPTSTCPIFPTIERPRQMVVYFYEGNDIEDNLKFLGRVNKRYGATDVQAIDRYINEQYAGWEFLYCHGQFAETTFKQAEFLSQYYITGYNVSYCGTPVPSKNHIVVGDRTIETPSLQGAAPSISDANMRLGMDVFARSLAWLRKRFEGVPITMVYVPSPISIYRHAEDSVSFCSFFGAGLIPKTLSERHHDVIRDMVGRISADQQVDFIDATPALREVARSSVIHGPVDWDHLNRSGYETLGTLVAARLQQKPQEGPEESHQESREMGSQEQRDDRSRTTTSLGSSSRPASVVAHDSNTSAPPSASEDHQTR